jgi:hypothetical protein
MYIFLYLHILFAWFAYFKDVYTRRYVYIYIYLSINGSCWLGSRGSWPNPDHQQNKRCHGESLSRWCFFNFFRMFHDAKSHIFIYFWDLRSHCSLVKSSFIYFIIPATPFPTHPFPTFRNSSFGWWFGTFFIFPYIGNIRIPTDFHIFQRGSNHQPVIFRW